MHTRVWILLQKGSMCMHTKGGIQRLMPVKFRQDSN